MSRRKYTWNAFETNLNGSLGSGVTTIPLDSTTNLRDDGLLVIDPDDPAKREYILFTTINGNSLEGVTRNLGGSVGDVTHSDGAVVRAVMMHQFIDDLFSDVEDLETADSNHVAASDPHTVYVKKAGDTMTADLAMGNNKVTGLAAPTAAGDAVNKATLDALNLTDLADIGDTPAASEYPEWNGTSWQFRNFDTQVQLNKLNQMAAPDGNVAFGANKATGVADPTAAQDAATKNYVDTIGNTNAAKECKLSHSVAQALVTGADTVLTWDTEDVDPENWHIAGNPTRITPDEAGLYIVEAQIRFAANTTGRRMVAIKKNGGAGYYLEDRRAATPTGHQKFVLTTVMHFTGTSFIEIVAYQDSGGNLDVEANNTHFRVIKIA